MLITNGGISRNIDENRLPAYLEKGYAPAGDFVPGPVAEKPLERMNKAELEAKAAELGIELPEGVTKKDIAGLIQACTEAQEGGE